MSDKKNWGQSVLGWFVVKEETAAAPGIDEDVLAEIRSAKSDPSPAAPSVSDPAPAAPAAPAVVPIKDLPSAVGGVDFVKVFEAFGVDQQERELWQRASDLVRGLPAQADAAVKKQIVEVSLKAFGIPIDKIIESGVEQIQALDSYQKGKGQEAAALKAQADERIAALEDEIRKIRGIIDESAIEQATVVATCNAKKLEVQGVLEFFGLEAVQRVVRESPKLIDPSTPPAGTETK
ncbi:MAG: hypothetical protein IT186_17515 [Acidobacteria bacterium]|nr:hypothetical protein [Acidobacteriota bacterium]MCK6685893.1 hypothetical protein [Thermoanaerobaculia bacterium]